MAAEVAPQARPDSPAGSYDNDRAALGTIGSGIATPRHTCYNGAQPFLLVHWRLGRAHIPSPWRMRPLVLGRYARPYMHGDVR